MTVVDSINLGALFGSDVPNHADGEARAVEARDSEGF